MDRSSETPPRPRLHFLVAFAAAVVAIAGIREAQDIVIQVLAAVFIAVAIAPPIFGLQRRGVPFALALVLVIAALLGVAWSMAGLIGSSVNDFTERLPEYETKARAAIGQVSAYLEEFGIDTAIDQALGDLIDPGRVMNLAGLLFRSVGGLLANSFLILIMVIFLLLEAASFPAKLQLAFGDLGESLGRFSQLAASVNRYLVIKTWISLITGALATALCAAFGLDFALLWGLLAFLLNYVPNVGSIVAAVPPVLLAMVQIGVGKALIILIGYLAINNILGNFVEPRFMGKGLGLSTFVVVLSLIFWGWVLGPVGMLLSIPLTMALKIAMEGAEETRWLAVMLDSGAAAEAAVAAQRADQANESEDQAGI